MRCIMKTIYVKDGLDRILHNEYISWKKLIPTAVFLFAMFLLGRAAAESFSEPKQTAGQVGE